MEEEKTLTPEQIQDIAEMNEALSKGNKYFQLSLREITKRNGGFPALSKKTLIGRESLYQMMSDKGNIKSESVFNILDALGYCFQLKVKDIESNK